MKYALSGVLRGLPAPALHVRCRLACSQTSAQAVIAERIACVLVTVMLGLGLHVNVSASAPRGLYCAVTGGPTRGAWVVACVSPQAPALARDRGYRGSGPCARAAQLVRKSVVAVGSDVVEIGPDTVTFNGQRLPGLLSAGVDSLGHALPHTAWGPYVLGAGELWLVSTRVPNSWDSRYLGLIWASQVLSVPPGVDR